MEDVTPSRYNNEEVVLASPRFLEPKVPKSRRIPPLTQSEAVPNARENILKLKPRIPSKLAQSSRAYQSLPFISETAAKRGSGTQAAVEIAPSSAVGIQQIGRTTFTIIEDWSMTTLTATFETMEVDSNKAGAVFARGLGASGTSRTHRYEPFDEWSKHVPLSVTALLQKIEADDDFAGQAFESGLDNYTKI